MAFAHKLPDYISPEDYLLLEERSLEKHEYIDGVIYEWQGGSSYGMAGGSKPHNRTCLNVYSMLRPQLRGGPCSVFVTEVKVGLREDKVFVYPDVVVTCSEADRQTEMIIREPVLIVEVLSDSTELFDRRAKFEAYRRFDSLESYVLVSPRRHMIEVFTRAGAWARTPETESVGPVLSGVVDLGTHGLKLTAVEVFEDVPFGVPT